MQEVQVILQKIAKGDIVAFEKLYKNYHHRLFVYARKFIYDEEIIRDILQEFFIDFWEKREKLDIKNSPESYLFRALHNRCIDYIRKTTIQNGFTDLSDVRLNELKAGYYSSEEGPLHTIFTEDIDAIVQKVLADLPDQCKRIFLMSRQGNATTQEIAEMMNISPRTVESHVYRVLKILKTHLSDYLPLFFLFFSYSRFR